MKRRKKSRRPSVARASRRSSRQPEPEFAQPEPTPAPGKFRTPHLSDSEAYNILDELQKEHKIKPIPFPPSRGGTEPIITLEQIWGSEGTKIMRNIVNSGQIVFHAVGDTGNTRSVKPQEGVADKMQSDFIHEVGRDQPAFFLHLGDVVYSFGEAQYYYDQFYEPYRDYPAPIIALAGNHDGMVAPGATATSLEAFLRNFCSTTFQHSLDAGGLDRTTMIQPGVYYTFEAPFVRIIALYSNTLEDPGVISTENGTFPQVTDVQLAFLRAALTRTKHQNYDGAAL